METELLQDFFGNFSMQSEKYNFYMEGSMWYEIEPTQGEIDHRNEYPSWGGGGMDQIGGLGIGGQSGG